jgi:DNA-directed RNA polymerase subunit RPC12/RpoP
MAKKTYECQGCGALFQVDEEEKEPRCTVCSGFALIEVSEERLQGLLNPLGCGSR